jgi:thiol-disulfide isomerase/thioredoxin
MNTEFPESSGIVKLTPNELQHKRPYFLVFYANWCGHCKLLSPIMEALSQKYVSMNRPKSVAAIDCAQHTLDSSFKNIVKGYPTIFSVKENSCQQYNGERTVEALDEHLNKRASETSSQTEETLSTPEVPKAPKAKKSKKATKTKKAKKAKISGGNIFSRMRSFRR